MFGRTYNTVIAALVCLMLCTLAGCAYRIAIPWENKERRLKSVSPSKYGPECPECDFYATEKRSLIRFVRNKEATNDEHLNIIHFEMQKVGALKSLVQLPQFVFFDDQTQLGPLIVWGRDLSLRNYSWQTSAYESNGIFHSDAKVAIGAKNYEDAGDVAGFYWWRRYLDPRYFTTVYFHDQNPVGESIIRFEIPGWAKVQLHEINFDSNAVERKEEVLKDGTTAITYTMENLEEQVSENGAPRWPARLPHILVTVESYQYKGEQRELFKDTDGQYKWYRKLRKSVNNDAAALQGLVDEITEGATTEEEKIKRTYYWVQDNIRYIAFEQGLAGFIPDNANNVCDKRYGDCKGMANLLCEMLKLQGFDARLTWIGTRGIPYDYSTPSLAVDNHMICALYWNGQTYYLDGTESYQAFGRNAHRIQGRQVMIEDGETYKLETVPEAGHAQNARTYSVRMALRNDSIVGNGTYQLKGESRVRFMHSWSSTARKDRPKLLKSYVNMSDEGRMRIIGDVTPSDLDNRDIPVELAFAFTMKEAVHEHQGAYYVSLDLYPVFDDFFFDSTRRYDYVFPYRYSLVYRSEFDIPEGYEVVYMPDTITFETESYRIAVRCKKQGKQVIYEKEIALKKAELVRSEMEAWNDAILGLYNSHAQRLQLRPYGWRAALAPARDTVAVDSLIGDSLRLAP